MWFYNSNQRWLDVSHRLIELKKVKKDYLIKHFWKEDKQVRALNNLNLSVDEGEIFGFLGPNGAGKTTTIKCIVGILKCDDGEILLKGKNIKEYGIDYKKKIGFLPEQIGLYSELNPIQTLKHFGGFYGIEEDIINEKSQELLKKFGLSKEAERKVGEFSLGMKKRLALACALIHNPQILVLDEPTSGLDPRGVKSLRTVLKELNENGITILLSSHDLSEVEEICTSVGIINKGEMIRQDSIENITDKMRKSGIRLLLKVKNFKQKHKKRLERKKGIRITKQDDSGKHTKLILKLNEDNVPWVTDKLVSEGVKIFSIEPKRRTLEDVFLKETEKENDD